MQCEGWVQINCEFSCHAKGLDEVVVATIMREVLKALDYVHKQGGIHRDIKVAYGFPLYHISGSSFSRGQWSEGLSSSLSRCRRETSSSTRTGGCTWPTLESPPRWSVTAPGAMTSPTA